MTKPATRGARFRDAILDAYEVDPGDAVLLDEIAGVIDEVDLATSVSERRLQRTLLSRLLAQLALPGPEGEPNEPRAVKARRAAMARWGRAS